MPPGRALQFATLLALTAPAAATPSPVDGDAPSARLTVEPIELDNGFRLLVVERPRASTVAAGWVAHTGSADEAPSERGSSHLLEHMMFKGTRTIGTRQPEREAALLAEIDRTLAALGRIDGEGGDRGERERLQARFLELREEARSIQFLGEMSLHYSAAGAVGLDANTLRDLTLYQVALPAERIELWFWLESDRLLDPVFRELEKEREVIAEEHRLRVGSTPTGALDERVDEIFWAGTPYAWRPLAGDATGARLTRDQLRELFAARYQPRRLAAALVGAVEPATAARLARRYFGRLPGGESGARAARRPAAFTARPSQSLFEGRCDCPPEARVLYPTVPFRHPDSYPFQVLAGILNGRSGRLHRSLVLEPGLAFTAQALEVPLARAGRFEISAKARTGTAPEALVEAWDRVLAELVAEPIPAAELERVRHQIAADAFRGLRDPEGLMRQLLIYDGLGDWREIEEWPGRIGRVSAEAVREAARSLIASDRRLVALYRPEAAAPTP